MWTPAASGDWHEDSVTRKFHRMKARDAPRFLENLRDNERHELENDEKRLKKIRARLARHPRGSFLLAETHASFDSWRREASARSPTVLGSLEARAEALKPQLCPGFDDSEHEEQHDHASNEVKASLMYFQQSIDGLGWRGVSRHVEGAEYSGGSLSQQEIPVCQGLFEQENESIFKAEWDKDGKQMLKYIHLPANHLQVSHIALQNLCHGS